jgi:hypothetical protein
MTPGNQALLQQFLAEMQAQQTGSQSPLTRDVHLQMLRGGR